MADMSPKRGVKRKRVHHSLHHIQQIPAAIEPAPQDARFAQSQLDKSLTAALTLAGFDGMDSNALEMLRGHTEEYMMALLSRVRTSMQGHRTTTPTPLDFSAALAETPNTSTASLLTPQLALHLPETISYPSIPHPPPPSAPAPDFSTLLQPLLSNKPPSYVPRHFPQLPAQHAYQATPVFPTREKDARKMREKATEEGAMAEQALRCLAAAQKAGAAKAESKRRSGNVLAGNGRVRDAWGRKNARQLFDEVLSEVGVGSDWLDERGEEGRVVVNSGMGEWRGRRGGVRM